MLAVFTANTTNLLILAIAWFTFGLKAFALADALLRPKNAYLAAGKLDKLKWCAIVGVAFIVNCVVWYPLSFLNVIGDVAAIVYLVDVRPAIRALGDGGAIFKKKSGGGGSASGW